MLYLQGNQNFQQLSIEDFLSEVTEEECTKLRVLASLCDASYALEDDKLDVGIIVY